jgi:hypothetical protein
MWRCQINDDGHSLSQLERDALYRAPLVIWDLTDLTNGSTPCRHRHGVIRPPRSEPTI